MIQYNSALAAPANVEGFVPVEAILVAGYLLAILETWPQRGRAPYVHVKAGLDLGRKEPEGTWKELSIKGYVLRGFMWMAHYLSAYYDGVSAPKINNILVYAIDPEGIPRSYPTLSAAIESVEVLLCSVMHLRNSEFTAEAQRRHCQLVALHTEISSAVAKSKLTARLRDAFHHDMSMLQVHLRVMSLMLDTYGKAPESTWDDYLDDFASILTDIEVMLPYEQEVCDYSRRAVYRPTLGLICPLFCVATKSRDSVQRRHALHLLHNLKRKERCWNSCIATQIAQAVVNLETRLSSPQLGLGTPEDCRVHLESVIFKERQQRILVSYRRMSASGAASVALDTALLPWEPQISSDSDFVQMSRKALACFGYTGIHMLVPAIACQCHPTGRKGSTDTDTSDQTVSTQDDLEFR